MIWLFEMRDGIGLITDRYGTKHAVRSYEEGTTVLRTLPMNHPKKRVSAEEYNAWLAALADLRDSGLPDQVPTKE